MKYLLVITGLLMLANLSAQDADKKEKRRIEKEKREQELKKKYNATATFVEGKQFVLEANYLQDKYGTRISVNSTINFIYIDSEDVVLQIGNNTGSGYNGVGGFTIEGKINSWELNKDDKRKTIRLEMSIMGSTGIYQVAMIINHNRQADAVLTSITSGRIQYSGNIVPIEMSRIYKARTSY